VAVYTPPNPPDYSGNPIADVQIAFEWSAAFFTQRAPAIRFTGLLVRSRILQM
jgi:hypothetical protein